MFWNVTQPGADLGRPLEVITFTTSIMFHCFTVSILLSLPYTVMHTVVKEGGWRTSCSVLVLCGVKSGCQGAWLLHSLQSQFPFLQVAEPTWHPVVVLQPKLMSAHTDHRSSLQHSLDSCTACTSGVTHLTLSHTHTGYRERGRGRGVHVAGAYSRLA